MDKTFSYLSADLLRQEGGPITNPALGSKLQKLSGTQFFSRLIPSLIGLGFVVGVIVFVFMFILGAIQWISSWGDKGQLEEARGKIIHSLAGLIILFALFALIKVIEHFFLDINILLLDIGVLKIE